MTAAHALWLALALLVAGAAATEHDRAWDVRGTRETCPQRRLRDLNSVLAVTEGREADRPGLLVDVLLAKLTASHRGCSVLDDKYEKCALPKVNLMLYYGEGENDRVVARAGQAESLFDDPHFDKDRCVAVYAFGYTSDPNNKYTRDAITALVSAQKYNVLLVDWSAANNLSYEVSVNLLERVAALVADDLVALARRGGRVCFAAGHSLGGQMTGAIARHMRRQGQPLPCAIALDPADPLFEGGLLGCAPRVAPGQADWLIVLHTDICGLGSALTHGDATFFPNGGHHGQPGCHHDFFTGLGTALGTCSHVRAVDFFAAAVRSPDAFPARRCASWEEFHAGACADQPLLHFARCDRQDVSGNFFMETTSSAPFRSTNPAPTASAGGGEAPRGRRLPVLTMRHPAHDSPGRPTDNTPSMYNSLISIK